MEAETTEREAWREQYAGDVIRAAEENHLWLNAFSCIKPTDDYLRMIGREVLRMLDSDDYTHVSETGHALNLPRQRELVLRVNKS